MDKIRTVFIDDELMFVQGLEALFQKHPLPILDYCGHHITVSSFLQDHEGECHLIIMDIDILDENIIEYVPAIKKKYRGCRVIVLSHFESHKLVRDMMKSGADGYILKSKQFNQLLIGIDAVLKGEAHLGEDLQLSPSKSLFKSFSKEEISIKKYEDRYQIKQKLTKREIEILEQIVLTKSNKEIGKELYISEQTVGVHKKNIMRKLNVKSTISLIKYAIEQSLV